MGPSVENLSRALPWFSKGRVADGCALPTWTPPRMETCASTLPWVWNTTPHHTTTHIHHTVSFISIQQKWVTHTHTVFVVMLCSDGCFSHHCFYAHVYYVPTTHDWSPAVFRWWQLWPSRVPREWCHPVWEVWRQAGTCGAGYASLLLLQGET